ncbi:hypothetical protein [Flavobacterium psychrotolerans]|nr:hypothetical protein [Flavobacterium psychrotolerans]
MAVKFNSESELKQYKILNFNLKLEPFNVMVTGEKKFEYRDISDHWRSRFYNKDGSLKHFDYVKFTHAYSSKNPFFICEFKGLDVVKNVHIKYSTGFEVNFDDERWAVKLGEIVLKGNLK